MKNLEAMDAAQTGTVAPQTPHVALETATSKKAATQKKGAPKGKKTAKGAKPERKAKRAGKSARKTDRKFASPRAESKGAKILEMIQRLKGATLAEIMKATDWQAHSVRGFISTAGKKHGVKVESSKSESGDRVYRAAK